MMSALTWSALPSQSCRTWKPSPRVRRSYLPTASSRSRRRPPTFHACAFMPARSRRSAWAKSRASAVPARISRRASAVSAGSSSAHASVKETGAIRSPRLGGGRRGAELLERRGQLGGDRQRVAVLDLAALEHVDDLAVAQQRD